MRRLSLILAIAILPGTAHAAIRDPSLQELASGASTIAVVHVQATVPAPLSTSGVLSMSFVVCAVALWRWRRARSKLRAILTASLLGVLLAVAGIGLSASLHGAHQSIALAKVQRALKGSASGTIAVFHDSNFPCDMSELTPGQDYVLFLQRHLFLGYRLSWYDCSVWQVTAEGVQAVRRSWDGVPPVPVDRFFRDVSSLQE